MRGFSLKDTKDIPKLGLNVSKFVHEKTGLTHIHAERADRNRVFALAFKTPAPDHTGLPHILEHTTLCGSQKFPVRDPFFKMQTRSLANYMNALTGSDYTYYPFATTNPQDFSNLQQVYMDSVFSPLLREQDFLQEGWRLEPQDLSDPNSPLIFKGVVFNEMKGQMSMPAYLFYVKHMMAIYPELQYSAGDPLKIPDLRYEDLVKYHREHYHPSNCLSFSYGDLCAEEALSPLHEYLETMNFRAIERPAAGIRQPESLDKVKKVSVQGPIDTMLDKDRQIKTSLTWYVGSPQDIQLTLLWRVLSILLTDGHGSPLYKALIDTGIAPEFSVNTGLDDTPAQLMFTVGVQGVAEADIQKFKTVLFQALAELYKSGIPQNRIDAILHQAELSEREIDANFGMNLLGKVVSRSFISEDMLMDTLDNDKLLNDFKERLKADPEIFIKELWKLLNEPYFEFTMTPNENYEKELQKAEADLLEGRRRVLNESEKNHLKAQGHELEKAQKAPQAVDVLPTVTSQDIPRKAPVYEVLRKESERSTSFTRITPTQGLAYFKISSQVSDVSLDLLPYLRLYSDALMNVGTEKYDSGELEDLIRLYTGGIGVSSGSTHYFGDKVGLAVGASGSVLNENAEKLYELLQTTLTQPLLSNVSKLKTSLDQSAGNILNSLSQAGHRYALNYATSGVSARKALDEHLGGFEHLKLIKRLSALEETDLSQELVPKLQSLHQKLWRQTRIGLTCEESALKQHEGQIESLKSGLLNSKESHVPYSESVLPPLSAKKAHVPLPFQVSYCGYAASGPGYLTKESAALQILSSVATHKYMHPEIREKGGAYGGGASFNAREGLFTMYSYRDPTPDNSLKVMSNIGQWAAAQNWTARDVEEGLISEFQSIDSPISPRSEIGFEYGLNESNKMRQRRRELLLDVKPEDLSAVAEEYLTGLESKASICVIGQLRDAKEFETIEGF